MTNTYAASNLYWPHADEWRPFDWADGWNEADQESRYEYWETAGEKRDTVYHSGSGTAQTFTATGRYAVNQPHEHGFEGELPEGPQMSGYWPLSTYLRGDDPDRAAWRMRDLSVCLVQVDETYGVALTGGGMDLSWQLAAGAIAAGYLPWSGLTLDSWEYGLSTVGEAWARRIRAAVRYRLTGERRRATYALNRVNSQWR